MRSRCSASRNTRRTCRRGFGNSATASVVAFVRPLTVVALVAFVAGQATADEIRVAVASNFAETMSAISARFEANTGHEVTLAIGSTGKHYAQIVNGAPFHAFLAADAERPRLLEQKGTGVPGSRFTYAMGRIVLWSPRSGYVDPEGRVLREGTFRHLAIANPRFAPYGRAGQEVLEARGVWEVLKGTTVRGENVAQAFHFVKSGNAELGFVAYSQVKRPGRPIEGSLWEVPRSLYTPIEQQGILLVDNDAARGLLTFLRSDEALKIIRDHGYDTP